MNLPQELQDLEDFHELFDQAGKVVVQSYLKRYIKSEIEKGNFNVCRHSRIVNERLGNKVFAIQPKEDKFTNSKWFITITSDPEKNIDPVKFFNQMKKCIKKKIFVDNNAKYKYVLEQRSEDPSTPNGWHIHCIACFDKSISASILRQQVFQCFIKFCYKTDKLTCIDTKPYDENRHDTYITGGKCEAKKAKSQADVILRKKLGIPEIVEN